MNNYKSAIVAMLMSTVVSSCCDSSSSIIWIEDEDCPGLPSYSEWGYNTYGAYVNGELFTVDAVNRPYNTQVVTSGNEICMDLRSEAFTKNRTLPEMKVVLPVVDVLDHLDLARLDKMTFDLSSEDCKVLFTRRKGSYSYDDLSQIKIASGTLTFKRVQVVYLDFKLRGTILSGTFEFKEDVGSNGRGALNVTHGRFDINIDEHNMIFSENVVETDVDTGEDEEL